MEINFLNPEQIINMGGPYVGILEINKEYICKNVIMDHYIIKDNLIYFVVYNNKSEWAKDNYFSIFYYDYIQKGLFEIKNKFQAIFLKEFLNEGSIKVYKAFHDKFENESSIIDIGKIPHKKVF
jgi:hypothetical protein